MAHVSASFSGILRVRLVDQPGKFAAVATAIGDAAALLGAIDLVRVEAGHQGRDTTILAGDEDHIARVADAVRGVPGVDVEAVSDRTFLIPSVFDRGVAPAVAAAVARAAQETGVARRKHAVASQ